MGEEPLDRLVVGEGNGPVERVERLVAASELAEQVRTDRPVRLICFDGVAGQAVEIDKARRRPARFPIAAARPTSAPSVGAARTTPS